MTESTLRRVKPVKASTLHAKAERYRDGFVKLFREYEGAQVVTEDGEIARDASNRRIFVTIRWFAREMGVPYPTFRTWVNGRSGSNETAPSEDEEDDTPSAVCSCIPDPDCPVHGKEKEDGTLANSHASGRVRS